MAWVITFPMASCLGLRRPDKLSVSSFCEHFPRDRSLRVFDIPASQPEWSSGIAPTIAAKIGMRAKAPNIHRIGWGDTLSARTTARVTMNAKAMIIFDFRGDRLNAGIVPPHMDIDGARRRKVNPLQPLVSKARGVKEKGWFR
jgi:hypothetical protein